MKEIKGCVYFFRHKGMTPIKIGYTNNETPTARFETMKTYSPFGAEILGCLVSKDAFSLEQSLHKKYVSKRLSGEWFDITEEDVQNEILIHGTAAYIEARNKFEASYAKSLIFDPSMDTALSVEDAVVSAFMNTKNVSPIKTSISKDKPLEFSHKRLHLEYNVFTGEENRRIDFKKSMARLGFKSKHNYDGECYVVWENSDVKN